MVDLYLTSSSQKQRSDPRYSMTTVDLQHSSAKNGKFAIFIVPQGKSCGDKLLILVRSWGVAKVQKSPLHSFLACHISVNIFRHVLHSFILY